MILEINHERGIRYGVSVTLVGRRHKLMYTPPRRHDFNGGWAARYYAGNFQWFFWIAFGFRRLGHLWLSLGQVAHPQDR